MTIGENGILTQAKNAVTQTNEATKNEEKAFDDIEAEIDYLVASSNDSSIDKDTYIVKKKIHNLITNHEKNASYVSDGEFGIEKEYAVDSSNKSIKIIKREQQNEDVKYYSVIKDNNNPESELVIKDVFKIYQCLVYEKDLFAEVGMTWVDWANSIYNEDKEFSANNQSYVYRETQEVDGNSITYYTQVVGYYIDVRTNEYWDCVSDKYVNWYAYKVGINGSDIISPTIPYGCIESSGLVELD